MAVGVMVIVTLVFNRRLKPWMHKALMWVSAAQVLLYAAISAWMHFRGYPGAGSALAMAGVNLVFAFDSARKVGKAAKQQS